MNSNNLELSLIENEIEKIQSKYQLKGNAQQQQQQTVASFIPQQTVSQQYLIPEPAGAIKSPSVVTFGGSCVQPNQQLSASSSDSRMGNMNTLQELTLNKQGKLPQAKDQKQQQQVASKINPKDLSNEELEYIIKTGKLPPRMSTDQQPQQSTSVKQIQPPARNASQGKQQPFAERTDIQQLLQQQQPSSQALASQQVQMMQKTQPATFSMKPNYPTQQQPIFDKENQTHVFAYAQPQMQQPSLESSILLKNYNSPRTMADFLAQKSTTNQVPYQMPFNSQPVQIPNTLGATSANSFQLDQSYAKAAAAFDQSQISSTSQAATQALKALQDRLKMVEQEKQLLEDQLSVTEGQTTETIKKLQQKLKEESEKAASRETQLKEELMLMKRQIETVEGEKLRHLEENSSERDHWRQQVKRLEEENAQIKHQLNEYLESQTGIEESLRDLKRREEKIREKYESELRAQKERNGQMEQEIEQCRGRYEELKKRLKKKDKDLEKENKELSDELQQLRDDNDRDMTRLRKECDKWKRECQMLKEEMSILGGGGKENQMPLQSQASRKGGHRDRGDPLKGSTPRGKDDGSCCGTTGRSCSKGQKCCSSPGTLKNRALKRSIANQSSSVSHFQSIDQSNPTSQQKSAAGDQCLSGSARGSHKDKSQQQRSERSQKKKNFILRTSDSCEKEQSQGRTKHTSASAKFKEGRPQKSHKVSRKQQQSSSSKHKRNRSGSGIGTTAKKGGGMSTDRSLNGCMSSQTISINTRLNKAETMDDALGRGSHQSSEYILIDQQQQHLHNNLGGTMLNDSSYNSSQQMVKTPSNQGGANSKFNQYKRSSIETLGLSQTSDMVGAMLYSHQSSVDQPPRGHSKQHYGGGSMEDDASSVYLPFKKSTMDIAELKGMCGQQPDRNIVDNEIFYLEREIFDYNQQYKTLLSQQSSSLTSGGINNTSGVTFEENGGQSLNSKLRQIAQMLEEKSERLFELKKQQQELLLKESYQSKNPFLEQQMMSTSSKPSSTYALQFHIGSSN